MPFPAFSVVRLTKALPELDLPQGAIGKIKRVVPGDDTKYVTAFDLLPGLVVDLYDVDFHPGSPQRCAEVVYPTGPRSQCKQDPECLHEDGHAGLCYHDDYL